MSFDYFLPVGVWLGGLLISFLQNVLCLGVYIVVLAVLSGGSERCWLFFCQIGIVLLLTTVPLISKMVEYPCPVAIPVRNPPSGNIYPQWPAVASTCGGGCGG